MRRISLIVNPNAGGGRGAALLPRYEALLRAAGHDVVVATTRDLDHAAELARAAVADDRVAAAVGGDGLVGRVAGALAGVTSGGAPSGGPASTGPASGGVAPGGGGLLAILPGGRGNDAARGLGIPADPAAACALLDVGRERALDLGTVDGVPYLCIASVGFDSAVQEVALATRLPLGGQVYTYGALRSVARWRHARFTIGDADGTRQLVGWAVAVANIGVYGGGMRLAPGADPADGLLDVVTTAATGRLRFLGNFRRVFAGTHVDLPEVEATRTAGLVVSADRPFRVFADGDPIARLPATFGILPSALRVLTP